MKDSAAWSCSVSGLGPQHSITAGGRVSAFGTSEDEQVQQPVNRITVRMDWSYYRGPLQTLGLEAFSPSTTTPSLSSTRLISKRREPHVWVFSSVASNPEVFSSIFLNGETHGLRCFEALLSSPAKFWARRPCLGRGQNWLLLTFWRRNWFFNFSTPCI